MGAYYLDKISRLSHEANHKLKTVLNTKIKDVLGIRVFLLFFKNADYIPLEGNILAVVLENEYSAERVALSCLQTLSNIVEQIWDGYNINVRIYYKFNDDICEYKTQIDNSSTSNTNCQVLQFSQGIIQNKYTFSNFVKTTTNACALEIAQSVACASQDQIVSSGSCILIQGQNGCGKTHILRAVFEYYSSAGGKVYYSTAMNFMKQYSEAAKEGRVFSFIDNILTNDIIVFDDLHTVVQKPGTIKAIRNIIERVSESSKYAILSSQAINLQEIMNSDANAILSKSMIVSIAVPDKQTKRQIAVSYLLQNDIAIEISIVDSILNNFSYDINQIKNALQRLFIFQKTRNIILNPALAIDILGAENGDSEQDNLISCNMNDVIKAVSVEFGIQEKMLLSPIKTKDVYNTRAIAMYLCYTLINATYIEIGRKFNKTHSTVIAAVNKVSKMIKEDKKLPGYIANIKANLSKAK